MHVTILAVGSRGDVEPFIALGEGLHDAGHDILLATSTAFESLVREHGLGFSPLEVDSRKILASAQGRAWVGSGRNPVRYLRLLRRLVEPFIDAMLDGSIAACRQADAVIYTPVAPTGYHIAEARHVPAILAALQPLTPTAEFPPVQLPLVPLCKGPYNRAAHVLVEWGLWQPFRSVANRWRAQLDLPPLSRTSPYTVMRRRREPILYGFSPAVLPKPADWGDEIAVTGYWFLPTPAGWQPPLDLAAFLDSGPPAVTIALGAMTYAAAPPLLETIFQGVKLVGRRAVLVADLTALPPLTIPSWVHVVPAVPYVWLFPRVAAVIHHGGVGTTHTALRAGVPNVVVPFFGDQSFWGRRVTELGAGPPPILSKGLTAARLATALARALDDPTIRRKAGEIGAAIQAEEGIRQAVSVIGGRIGGEALSPT